jgi:hypothetical protein
VCTPISEGGLKIRNLLRFNLALLGKWLWRYGMERAAWWRVVMDYKCGSSWRAWCSSEPVGMYGVGLRNNNRKGWGKVRRHIRFEVGDSSKIRFWHDLWCGDMTLKDAFPVLFGTACAKDAPVKAYMELLGSVIQWNVSFARSAQDWVVDACLVL